MLIVIFYNYLIKVIHKHPYFNLTEEVTGVIQIYICYFDFFIHLFLVNIYHGKTYNILVCLLITNWEQIRHKYIRPAFPK